MSDKASQEQARAYQTQVLGRVLERCLYNVPYYRERYGKLKGREPWDILRAIEPIAKKDVQADPERFHDSTVASARTYETSTGGTTGEPLKILLDKVGFQIEWAFMIAQWRRAGFQPGMRRATFRGVVFQRGRLWQLNPAYDELQFSPFRMNSETLPRYVERLRKYQPAFLYGYPSALSVLAQFVKKNPDCGFPLVKGILAGSEGLREGQREFLEETFKARVFSWYGMSEKVILAGECERSSLYHSFPQYGVTEILDGAGSVSEEVGTQGELVGTGFLNTAMPLVRYRTGDFSSIVGDRCRDCGRSGVMLGSVHGRWVQEMVLGRHGSPISLTALNMHGKVFSGIERFQFHQRQLGKVTLRVIPATELSEEHHRRILDALYSKTGDEIEWTVEPVRQITLSSRGKSVFLVQEMEVASEKGEAQPDRTSLRPTW